MRIVNTIVAALLICVASAAPTLPAPQPAPQPAACCDLEHAAVQLAGVLDPYVEVRLHDRGGDYLGCGSGVVIELDGKVLVLTAAHVAEGGFLPPTLTLHKEGEECGVETTWQCDVESVSKTSDLALLKPRETTGLKAARYDGDTFVRRGETCWYCGTPRGLHASLEKSIVNRPCAVVDDRHYLLVNGNGWYGNSGCGVYV